MRIAVVTPYYKEPMSTIRRCVDSVLAQSVECTHILVSDGAINAAVAELPVQHVLLPVSHNDYGDTPRMIGSLSAVAQGFDALLWLDADNWFDADHVERMLDASGGVSVVTSSRKLWRPDGSYLGVCNESDGVRFNDTNCYLLRRPAFELIRFWGFKDNADAVIGDRIVWSACLRSDQPLGRNPKPTVNYTSFVAAHYLARDEVPPADARIIIRRAGESHFRSLLYRDFIRGESELRWQRPSHGHLPATTE